MGTDSEVSQTGHRDKQRYRGSDLRHVVFDETLVISTQAYGKQHARRVLEAVDPLPPFAPLAADVDNEEVMVAEAEEGLVDASRPCPFTWRIFV